jgi:hypothetical protein
LGYRVEREDQELSWLGGGGCGDDWTAFGNEATSIVTVATRAIQKPKDK